ncbi:hypothetical protein Afil01_29650 [Actinorhabdospora filicis]|uniref:Uncharacterized protein n=1 Tax=Actinorhabdospora filicis TaxID=1785913 RepID=A0A9W6W9M6_9ACTN|nr:hypothetical protein Afil01_29650 [Actinorhabdospora filicis]
MAVPGVDPASEDEAAKEGADEGGSEKESRAHVPHQFRLEGSTPARLKRGGIQRGPRSLCTGPSPTLGCLTAGGVTSYGLLPPLLPPGAPVHIGRYEA